MLKFFKGKDKGNLIYAPCKGRVVPLAEVPDPVFADKVLGDGFAVIPADGRIYAPADGEVAMVFDTLHAVTLTSTQGAEILIHIGLDTVTLKGEPFKAHVAAGDKVKKGDLLIEADLDKIEKAGLNTIIPVLICITGKQGFYTIISLILNTVIFAYGFQAFTEGKNILNICNVIAVLFSLTTLICLNGIHRKTFSSVLSTLCVLFLIMALFEFSIYMYGDLDYSNLEYLGSTGNSADIFWADIMLTGLGAIMDVTVTISAAVGEIVQKNPSVSLRRLIHSGREIGYDIMGTMINVLLFVLASGMIPMFILKMNNDISFITIVRYHIPYDICRFLIESIGIVLAIPVSVFIASAIMKIPSRKRGVRE